MESQPQNPEFRNNPENFYPCSHCDAAVILFGILGSYLFLNIWENILLKLGK